MEAGPNAVLALRREGYRWRDIDLNDIWDTLRFPGFPRLVARYWRTGLEETVRSASKRAFVNALRALVPDINVADLVRAGSGVRAQALNPTGALVDDFQISEGERMIHLLNAPLTGGDCVAGYWQHDCGSGGGMAGRACLARGSGNGLGVVHLRHLTLQQFRSYTQLDLSLPPGLTLILGDNAAGKSNLLEAAYILAATRSPRATTEGELIAWEAPPPRVMRIAGEAERRDGTVAVEIALAVRTNAQGHELSARSGAPLTSKRLRLNGIARRATDVVGQIRAVLFTTLDIEIISGSPGVRRRYLDLTITQADRMYARAYGRYEKALTQRNALLRRIGEGQARVEEIGPWDDIMAEEGATIVTARVEAIRILAQDAAAHHRRIAAPDAAGANGAESAGPGLTLQYQPALGPAGLPEVPSAAAVQEHIHAAIAAARARETAAGTTLIGPHRDDLAILLNGRPVSAYASRAQHRTVALALRLAEADLLRTRTGEEPILLLDDLFSELDPDRRAATAVTLREAGQVILTSADTAAVPAELPAPATTYRVEDRRLHPLAGDTR